MKRWLRILSVLLAVFLSLPALPATAAGFQADVDGINRAAKSVLMLEVYDRSGQIIATGSGFVAFDSGTLVTNYHVMEDAGWIMGISDAGDQYRISRVIAADKDKDIALLQFDTPSDLTPLSLASGEAVRRAAPVVAIGSPKGVTNLVSTGIISALYEEDGVSLILFTAPISHGSSGGALFNDDGQVIGITSAYVTDTQNMNLAVNISEIINLHERSAGAVGVMLRDYVPGTIVTATPRATATPAGFLGAVKEIRIAVTPTSLILTWDAVPSAKEYRIFRAASPSGKYSLLDTVNIPVYYDMQAVPGETYYYKIQCANGSRASEMSPAAKAVLPTPAPTKTPKPTPTPIIIATPTSAVMETPIPVGRAIDRWGITNISGLNFRTEPSTSSQSQGKLSKGTYVWMYESLINDNGEDWIRVWVNGQDGYIKPQYINMMTKAESDAYQATLSTPMPTLTPRSGITPTPTPIPGQYTGYALIVSKVALRFEVSNSEQSILTTLPINTLVSVKGQIYQDNTAWSLVETLDEYTGYVPDASLRRINEEEAKYYIDDYNKTHATPKPTPTPYAEPSYPLVIDDYGYINEYVGYPRLNPEITNVSGKKTVDGFTLIFYCEDAFHEKVERYGFGDIYTEYTYSKTVKPGQTLKPGYAWLSGYKGVKYVNVAIKKIHTTDGTTITIPDSQLHFYYWTLD